MHEKRTILLIQSPVRAKYRDLVRMSSLASPPLGLLYLATYLREHGYDPHVRDYMYAVPTKEDFVKTLQELKPDILGLNAIAINCEGAKEIATLAKSIVPDMTVVMGGVMPTFRPKNMLEQPDVDFVVLGEGELTLLELCDVLLNGGSNDDFKAIRGLAFRENGRVVITDERELIADLSILPIPDRSFLPLDSYTIPLSIVTSRGCIGKCTFCSAKPFWKRCRLRDMSQIKEEFLYLNSHYRLTDMLFNDDTFTVNEHRVREICEFMITNNFRFRWFCNSRVDTIGKDCYKLMYRAGCRKILLGVESGDDRILRCIGKNITCEQAERAVAYIKEAGMQTGCAFILGHPEDSIETVKKTLAFARHLKDTYACSIEIMNNVPYPGTPQYENAEELGLRFKKGNWDIYAAGEIIEGTKHISNDVMKQLLIGNVDGDSTAISGVMDNKLRYALTKMPTQKGMPWAQ
jgi:anaerobic magnesium-protoporphyrin IX monomethyl ester cyclase